MVLILALIPIKPSLPAALQDSAHRLASVLQGCDVRLRICPEVGDGRPYSAHAAARNAMLDEYLRPHHTHVLWIDADLTEYSRDLAAQLYAVDGDGIVSPFVLIEGTDRFYDTRGFVDSMGRWARPNAPYMAGDGLTDRIPMMSVGCCYIAPARLYQHGVRYLPIAEQTEHWSVMTAARLLGLSITAARAIVVRHANLPRYGEAWHAWPAVSIA